MRLNDMGGITLPSESNSSVRASYELSTEDFKKFVESYRCRLCKTDLTLDNFGGLGSNHMIFCIDCKPKYEKFLSDIYWV